MLLYVYCDGYDGDFQVTLLRWFVKEYSINSVLHHKVCGLRQIKIESSQN